QHPRVPRTVAGSNTNARKQSDTAVRTHARRRPLRPHDHHRLLRLYREVKKKCRFLEAVRPMRHNDSGNLRTLLEYGIDISSKLQPLIRCDVRAWNIRELRRLHLSVSSDLRDFGNNFANRFSNVVTAKCP